MKKLLLLLLLVSMVSCSSDDDSGDKLISLTIKRVWATDVTSTTVGSSLGITYYALDFGTDEKLNVGELIPGYGVFDDYTYLEDGVWTVSNVTSRKSY